MEKPKHSFFRNILLSFIIIGIIPPLILTFLAYTFSYNILQDAIYDQASGSVVQMNESIYSFLEEYQSIMSVIEEDATLREALKTNEPLGDSHYDINEKIYFLLASKKYKFPIYILNKEGQSIYETASLPPIYKGQATSNWGIFRNMNETDEVVFYPQRFKNYEEENFVMTLGKRIAGDNGEVLGYVLVDVKRDAMMDILYTLGNSRVREVMLIDSFGYTVLDAMEPEIEGTFWDSPYRFQISDNKQGDIYIKDEKVPELMVYSSHKKTGLTLVGTVPLNIVEENNSFLRNKIMVSFMVSLSLAILISIFIALYTVRPIKKLASSMKKVEEGDLTTRVNLNRNDELGMLEKSFNQMVVRLKESLDNTIEQQKQLRIAEIKILQAQINPHFLYNTLDAIKWTAKLNQVTEISETVTHLGKLLRNSINTDQEFLTIESNLELVHHYLKIQELRYSDGFSVEMDIKQNILEAKAPKLILQPIVENAIVHGFENVEHKGILKIIGYEDNGDIYFHVEDNGIGMTKETLEKALKKKSHEHIGLYNVDQRIKLYYGEQYGITVSSVYEEGTRITICIPKQI